MLNDPNNLLASVPVLAVSYMGRHAASLKSSGARFGISPTAFELTLKTLLDCFGTNAEC